MQPTDKELAEALEVLRVVTSRAMQDSPTRNAYDTVAAALRTARQARDGEVVVTRDEDGEIVMVSRQNADGEFLEVIASTCHAGGKATHASASEAKSHRWNAEGEKCLDCGDKDWMGDPVCRPRQRLTDEQAAAALEAFQFAAAGLSRPAPASGEGQQGERKAWTLTPDDKLPCDVRLPPATTINKGVSVGTLLASLEQRVLWGDGYDGKFPEKATQQQAGQAVAYLDLGVGGYMDVGTDLSDDELAKLPKGRHMLGIIGTYGVDGYTAAPASGEGQQGERLSPMAKMAEALRAKAAAERSEFDARVQAGEWGPMPEAGTQSEFCRACDGTGWDGESRVDVCPACNGGREKSTQQQAGQAVPELFVQWLEREMPPGTVIGRPSWWAPRLARALRNAERGVLGGCNG